jgi:hypothetical protein
MDIVISMEVILPDRQFRSIRRRARMVDREYPGLLDQHWEDLKRGSFPTQRRRRRKSLLGTEVPLAKWPMVVVRLQLLRNPIDIMGSVWAYLPTLTLNHPGLWALQTLSRPQTTPRQIEGNHHPEHQTRNISDHPSLHSTRITRRTHL